MTSKFNLVRWYRDLCAEGGGMKLNQKPSTLWETMRLDDEWKARLEAAVLAEREACARICEHIEQDKWGVLNGRSIPGQCSTAIRCGLFHAELEKEK